MIQRALICSPRDKAKTAMATTPKMVTATQSSFFQIVISTSLSENLTWRHWPGTPLVGTPRCGVRGQRSALSLPQTISRLFQLSDLGTEILQALAMLLHHRGGRAVNKRGVA